MNLFTSGFDRQFKCVTDYSFYPETGEDSILNNNFLGSSRVELAAHVGVLPFVIFTNNEEVYILRLSIGQRGLDAGEEIDRTEIDILLKGAPDRQQ